MEFCKKCGLPIWDDGMSMVPLTICTCPSTPIEPQVTIQQKCPICEGHGIVPGGFYNSVSGAEMISSSGTEMCRNCNGTGVVYVKQ